MKNKLISLFLITNNICFGLCVYFNTKNSVIYHVSDHNSYFGYTVQLQASRNQNQNGRVIVGAPKANSTLNNYRTIIESGVVYSCSVGKAECNEIILDSEGITEGEYNNFNYKHGKEFSGLGSSLDADIYTDGILVACSPRWINSIDEKTSHQVGMCYLSKSEEKEADKLIPLLDTSKDYIRAAFHYILGQAGFAVHLSQDSSSLLMSAPGLLNWTGSLIQYNDLQNSDDNFYVVNAQRKDVGQFAYLGYALNSGKFNSSNLEQIYNIVSAPRVGTVNIFEPISNEDPFQSRYQFKTNQPGEYFGASLAVADVNGDGVDDLIVGAPMFSQDNEADFGRIYIYTAGLSSNALKFNKADMRFGELDGSKFGYSISSLGDINKDGFEDIAVGAPFYNKTGAVYIYLGSKKGLEKLYNQKILARDFPAELNGFGFSLSRGLDVDNNKYNDLAIGAYKSAHVVLLKTQPIVEITPKLFTNISTVDSDTKQFEIFYCIKYLSKEVLKSLQLDLTLTILSRNVVFEGDNHFVMISQIFFENTEGCNSIQVFAKGTLLKNVVISIDYRINFDNLEEKFWPIQKYVYNKHRLVIPFANQCKSSKCQVNLNVSANFNKKNYIIGSKENINTTVTIHNRGEIAYYTKLFIRSSKSVTIINKPHYCSQSSYDNRLVCEFNQPISEQDNRVMKLTLDLSKLLIDDKEIYLNFTVVNQDEIDVQDNSIKITLPVKTDVAFVVNTKSLNERIETLSDNVPSVHQFAIENIGETRLNTVEIDLWIPYSTSDKEYINIMDITGCSTRETTEDSDNTIIDAGMQYILHASEDNMLILDCSDTMIDVKCKKIWCEIKEEEFIQSVFINVTMLINTNTLNNLYSDRKISLITTLQIKSKYIQPNYHTTKVNIFIIKAANIAMWISIGVSAGILMLLILGLILYKCNCFKSKLSQGVIIKYDAEEMEKLNEGNNINKTF